MTATHSDLKTLARKCAPTLTTFELRQLAYIVNQHDEHVVALVCLADCRIDGNVLTLKRMPIGFWQNPPSPVLMLTSEHLYAMISSSYATPPEDDKIAMEVFNVSSISGVRREGSRTYSLRLGDNRLMTMEAGLRLGFANDRRVRDFLGALRAQVPSIDWDVA